MSLLPREQGTAEESLHTNHHYLSCTWHTIQKARSMGGWCTSREGKKERKKGLKSNGTQIPIIETYLQKHKEGHSGNLIILWNLRLFQYTMAEQNIVQSLKLKAQLEISTTRAGRANLNSRIGSTFWTSSRVSPWWPKLQMVWCPTTTIHVAADCSNALLRFCSPTTRHRLVNYFSTIYAQISNSLACQLSKSMRLQGVNTTTLCRKLLC
jgi:hypothetical protein